MSFEVWQAGDVTLRCGDALNLLRQMPEASVHCCVTSPPYWGLRDYGIAGQLGLEATPDCGLQGFMRIRCDLTPTQREYVARRLMAEVLPDALLCGKDSRE